MAIPQIIKQYAEYIRIKMYGREVRESIARGIEVSGEISEGANIRSVNTENRQTILEKKYNEQIANATDITEIKDFHVSGVTGKVFPTMGKRADDFDTQLADAHKDLSSAIRMLSTYDIDSLSKNGNLDVFIKAIQRGYCIIVFWGDSITQGSNALNPYATWVELFKRKLQECFPNVTFIFLNYGLGGRTIEQAYNPEYTSPNDFNTGWSTVDGQSWRDYVKNAKPDLVITLFGMNAPSTVQQQANCTSRIIQYMYTWDKVPSYLFMTNFLPRKEWRDRVEVGGWEKRLACARATREYIKSKNYALIDIGRKHRLLTEGIDEVNFILRQVVGISDWLLSGTTYTYKDVLYNFSLVLGAKFDSEVKIKFRDNSYFLINPNGTVRYYSQGVLINEVTITAFTPNTVYNVDVSAQGAIFTLSINKNVVQTVTDYSDFYDGLLSVTSQYAENFTLTVWEHTKTTPSANDDILFGTYDPNNVVDTRLPFGGNGVNHLSSIGVNLIFMEGLLNLINVTNTLHQSSTAKAYTDTKLANVSSQVTVSNNFTYTDFSATGSWGNGGKTNDGIQLYYVSMPYNLDDDTAVAVQKSDKSFMIRKKGLTASSVATLKVGEFSVVNQGGTSAILILPSATQSEIGNIITYFNV